MVCKSLVALFSPGASCSTSPWYHALHPLHSQSFSSAIGLLNAVQHLCSCTMQYFKSPLSLQREDSFITLDLNEIFSILTQNFASLPWKLMVSHSQGFRVSSLPSMYVIICLCCSSRTLWNCLHLFENKDGQVLSSTCIFLCCLVLLPVHVDIVQNRCKQLHHTCGELLYTYWHLTHT